MLYFCFAFLQKQNENCWKSLTSWPQTRLKVSQKNLIKARHMMLASKLWFLWFLRQKIHRYCSVDNFLFHPEKIDFAEFRNRKYIWFDVMSCMTSNEVKLVLQHKGKALSGVGQYWLTILAFQPLETNSQKISKISIWGILISSKLSELFDREAHRTSRCDELCLCCRVSLATIWVKHLNNQVEWNASF